MQPDRRHLLRSAALGAGAYAASCSSARARASAPDRATAPAVERASRLDELFAALTDQRASVAPISVEERRARRARCAAELQRLRLDAFLCEGGATMRWLADVSWGHSERLFALCVLADGTTFWLCPAFEASRAREKIDAGCGPGETIIAWDEHEYAFRPLAAALEHRRARLVSVEPAMRHGFVARLAAELGPERISPLSGVRVVFGLRARKDAHELAILRRASELTQAALVAVAATLEPGLDGSEVGARIDHAHRRLGMQGPWNLSLVGPAAALPHGEADRRALAKGELLLVDCGASLHGYQSDTTRTWTVGGPPSEEIAKVWRVVRDAQQRSFDFLRPGLACRELDAIARTAIGAAGYGEGYQAFTHRLGHGIGMEGHEAPYFDGGSEVELAPGMTLSNEPGIYLPGRFGVRLEDIVVVTETGADHFGGWQQGPTSPA